MTRRTHGGIWRVQRILWWAAALAMLTGFALIMLIVTTFVR